MLTLFLKTLSYIILIYKLKNFKKERKIKNANAVLLKANIRINFTYNYEYYYIMEYF